MNGKKLLCLGLAAVLACTSLPAVITHAQETQTEGLQEKREVTSGSGESEDVFRIKDGVLLGYTGNGGDVVIPDGVIEIDYDAFRDCSSLTSITIPEGVTDIHSFAFQGCSELASVKFPNSMEYIGYFSFSDCESLTNITIPKGVRNIDGTAFSGCDNLMSISVEEGNSIYDSRNHCNAVIEKESNTLLLGCKNTVIPSDVTSIGGLSFYNCAGLTGITIPEGVTGIGCYTFLCF